MGKITRFAYFSALAAGLIYAIVAGNRKELETKTREQIISNRFWFIIVGGVFAIIVSIWQKAGFWIGTLVTIVTIIAMTIRYAFTVKAFNDGTHPWYRVQQERNDKV